MPLTRNQTKKNRNRSRNDEELLETVDQEANNVSEVEQPNEEDEQLDVKHLAPLSIEGITNKWPEPISFLLYTDENSSGNLEKMPDIYENHYKYNTEGHFVWTNQLVNRYKIGKNTLVYTYDALKKSENKMGKLKATVCDLENPEKSFYLKSVGNLGLGLFAKHGIPKDECVGEYTGELITSEAANKRRAKYRRKNLSSYFYTAQDDKNDDRMVIDAQAMGNHTRFINHSCEPNCVSKSIIVDGVPRRMMITTKSINKGEQLYLNYGNEYFTDFKCECNTDTCFENFRELPEVVPQNLIETENPDIPDKEVNEPVMNTIPTTKQMGEGNILLKEKLTAKKKKRKERQEITQIISKQET